MERYVRKATAEDLPVVLDLIESGRRIMRENGNPHQWGDSHPTVGQIEDDIVRGHSYLLMENGRAIATFAFIPGPDVTYIVIYDGQWIDADRPYYVLHRVASAQFAIVISSLVGQSFYLCHPSDCYSSTVWSPVADKPAC